MYWRRYLSSFLNFWFSFSLIQICWPGLPQSFSGPCVFCLPLSSLYSGQDWCKVQFYGLWSALLNSKKGKKRKNQCLFCFLTNVYHISIYDVSFIFYVKPSNNVIYSWYPGWLNGWTWVSSLAGPVTRDVWSDSIYQHLIVSPIIPALIAWLSLIDLTSPASLFTKLWTQALEDLVVISRLS